MKVRMKKLAVIMLAGMLVLSGFAQPTVVNAEETSEVQTEDITDDTAQTEDEGEKEGDVTEDGEEGDKDGMNSTESSEETPGVGTNAGEEDLTKRDAENTEDVTTKATTVDTENVPMTETVEDAETEGEAIVWEEGKTVEYNGVQYKTLQDALIQVGNDNLGADETAVINCKPNANVGGLFRAVVKNNLVINGNDAYVSDDDVIIPPVTWFPETSDHAIAIELGKDNVTYPLEHDINIEINQLDGIAIWGGRVSENKVNIEINDCQNMHKVLLAKLQNSVDGTTNISLDNCSFKHSEDPKDYGLDFTSIRSNYSGTISVTNTTFEGVHIPIDASNKFENGSQNIIVKNSTFTNCGTGGKTGEDDTTQIAAPIRVTTAGAGSSANLVVENCQFLGDNEKINGDILLGDGTFKAPAEQGSITLDMSNTKANVMLQEKGYYGILGNVNEEKAETYEVLENQTLRIDKDGNVNIVEKHINVTHVAKKDATCTEDGNIEYWYCEDCGKYFSDEACTTELTKDDTVLKAKGHVDADKDGKCDVCKVNMGSKPSTDPEPKPEPGEGGMPKPETKPGSDSNVPKTGDTANVAGYLMMALAAGAAIVTVVKKRRG